MKSKAEAQLFDRRKAFIHAIAGNDKEMLQVLADEQDGVESAYIGASYGGDGGGFAFMNSTERSIVLSNGNIVLYSGANRYSFNDIQYSFPTETKAGCLVNDGQNNLSFQPVTLPSDIEQTDDVSTMQQLYIDNEGKVWKH